MPNTELDPLQLNTVRVPRPGVYKTLGLLASVYFGLRGGISAGWEEELFPTTQGRIFAINHKNNIDPPAVGHLLAKAGIDIYTLGKIELSKHKSLDKFLGGIGNIPFDRDTDLLAQPAGAMVAEILDSGGNLVVFPEKHRYPGEELGPMEKVGALAVRRNAIVYPAAIAGTNVRRSAIRMEVGAPYNVNPVLPELAVPRRQILRQIDNELPDCIKELYDQAKAYIS